ncbi:AT-hook motif nuclear-localized protein 1-like, partial [Hibiscus syriacus]|uniref:AT-hook motif nuclear-localized protein 1-like n=1 Tax=Hibiscus syriacus TaxID=106335 RepID=UPI001920B2A8
MVCNICMETNSGFTLIGAEASSACHMAPRTENADQIAGGITAVNVPPVSDGLTGSIEKKKRGRPRKYGPDGTMTRALSPMHILSSILSVSGEFSSGGKQGRGRGSGYQIKHHKGMDMENLGNEGHPFEESLFLLVQVFA